MTLQRQLVRIVTNKGWATVDAFVDPAIPGLALTRLPGRGWSLTHVVSGHRLSPHTRTRRALEGVMDQAAKLRDWTCPLPSRSTTEFTNLQEQLRQLFT